MRSYTQAVLFILAILITAHIIAPDTYDLTEHTISQLAANTYNQGWVMRVGMFGFGALVLVAALSRLVYDRTRKWKEGPLVICGFMFLLASFFSTRPFQPDIPYSELEALIHGASATTARIAVSASMLAHAVQADKMSRRAVHVFVFCLVIGLNVLLELMEQSAGIIQRILVVVVLIWMVFIDNESSYVLRREKGELAV